MILAHVTRLIFGHHYEALTTPDDRRILRWWGAGLVVFVIGFTLFAWPAKAETLLPHPRGCPRVLFCGCGAAVELFGRPVRALWLGAAWLKFPRTSPAPGMVAVGKRKGGWHVFVLRQHVQGNVWLAADYNSGKHLSRLHQRSIAGFAIVNPLAVNVAGVR